MGVYIRQRVRLAKGVWLGVSTRIPRSSGRGVYPYWAQLAVGLSVSVALVILAANLG